VNRSIYFHAVAFLFLSALLLVVSDQLSRLSAPRSILESGKAIDKGGGEKTTLTDPHAVTKPNLSPVIEIRSGLFGVGLFSPSS
jgi:hypothetical protein